MKLWNLADYLTGELDLTYLSDLHYPEKIRLEKLCYLLENKISYEDFPENEWIDICEYITGRKEDRGKEAYCCLKEWAGRER